MNEPNLIDGPNLIDAAERARRLRGRNLATLAALIGLIALFYAITLARLGGG